MKSLVMSVMLSSVAVGGSLGLQQAGTDAQYTGPNAPSPDLFDYDYTIAFGGSQALLTLNTSSPSGSQVFQLEPSVINEISRAFFDHEALELAVVSDTIDFTTDSISDANIDQVDRVEITWWDPQFDDGFLATSLQIRPSAAPNVVTVPEPELPILIATAVLFCACLVRSGRCRLVAVVLGAVMSSAMFAPAAHADDEHHHTHPEFTTPIGISRWMHTDDLDLAITQGPTLHVRDDGSLKMYAQQELGGRLTWFHRNLVWRWKDASEGPFSTSCVYVPDGDLCAADFYGLLGGKPLKNPDGSLRQLQQYINYVQEQPGYLPPSVAQDTNLLMENLWFEWDSAEMVRGPTGTKIVTVDESLGADSLILVSNNPPSVVPESSSMALCVAGLMCLVHFVRKGVRRGERQFD